MAEFFFLLSWEHPSLPSVEFKAVLEAEGIPFKIVEEQTQVLCIEASPTCVEAILRSCGMAKMAYLKLFSCAARVDAILASLNSASSNAHVRAAKRFAVKVRRVRGSPLELAGKDLERRLGTSMAKRPGVRVDLEHSEILFQGLLINGRFFFGIALGEVVPKAFAV